MPQLLQQTDIPQLRPILHPDCCSRLRKTAKSCSYVNVSVAVLLSLAILMGLQAHVHKKGYSCSHRAPSCSVSLTVPLSLIFDLRPFV